MKLDSALSNALITSPLFKGVSPQTVDAVITDAGTHTRDYARGEVIFSREVFTRGLCCVLKGEVSVQKPSSELSMRILGSGDFFGAECTYSPRTYCPVDYVAVKASRVLFIDRSEIFKLTMIDPIFTSNYLTFLSELTYFLYNSVIIYTGGSAESRLASFLNESFSGYKTLQLRQPMNALAKSLDIGRASLYRAFDALIEAGVIEKEGKYIRLLSEDGLVRFI